MSSEENRMTPGTEPVGRNEPCPCGSGKKYKRCHGVSAAPKLSEPRQIPKMPQLPAGAPPGFSPDQMDSAQMMQVAQMLQRLPKGQMQKLQSIMQRAMAGKDVTREAGDFEKTLPLDLQNMLHSMKLPGMPEAGATPEATAMLSGPVTAAELEAASAPASAPEMTPEQARALVEEAAREGKISREEADRLLANSAGGETPAPETSSGISKLFRWGKKS